MAAIARSGNRQKRLNFIRDIPLLSRQKLCRILDVPGPGANWKTLAALLDFTADDCYSFEKALYLPGGSPTDEMLKVWDFGNHTVTELYNKLYQMNHARGMMLLQDYAGHMGFTADDLNDFGRVWHMSHGSPSDLMLASWDRQNHTITELFDKLYEMKHARGMMILEDLVDAAHREKIKKVQGEQPDDSNEDGNTNTLALNHQQQQSHPNRRRQPAEDTYTSGKLQGGQPSDMPPGASYSPDSTNLPMPDMRRQPSQNQQRPQLSRVREAEASVPAAAPSPWNESQRTAMQRNLDGGTQKLINSPLMKPSMPNFRMDGTKLSEDNNPADSGASAATGASVTSTTDKKSEREEEERRQKSSSLSAVMTIKYEEIQRETQNFSDSYKLGSGSFGTVYYMVYIDTKYAIKRLHPDDNPNSSLNAAKRRSLLKEITTLATYRHPDNIVSLCYYSTDGPEPCLVYEYLQNGSLEDNLQCRGPHKKPLQWRLRNEIALGAAIGLRYLHDAQDKPLIHGDIKSANILLDKNFQPKIGDFGLARPGPENGCTQMTMKTSKAYGTLPYLPKDFLSSFKLSVKVDVYSFGIVLMEILTGEKAADEKREPQKWLSQIVIEIVDSLKNESDFEKKLVDRLRDKRCSDWPWDLAWQMLELSLKCVHKFPQRRPEMKEVVKRLQEINDRMKERDALMRQRSLPTQNTEPLSCFNQVGSAELPSQDPGVTSTTQEQSRLDQKLRDIEGPQQAAVEAMSPLDLKVREVDQQQQTAAEEMSPLDQKFHDHGMTASTQSSSPAANNVPTYGNNTPGGYNQYRPPTYRPQDLCSIPQQANIPPHGQIPGSTPQQSFPTGTSSTVPSSYMNRPTPPSTATTPSTNPPTYDDFSDDSRYKQVQYQDDPGYNQGRYPSGNQYRGYVPPNDPYHQRVPYPPQSPYQQYGQPQYIPNPYEHQGYPQQYQDGRFPSQQPRYRYPQDGGYFTQQQQQFQYQTAYRQYRENPPRYAHNDPMASINPANFTAMPPTPGASPSPDAFTGMHDRQMARLDHSQLPAEFMHRGPDLSGGMPPTESRNTPPPLTSARVPSQGDDHHTTNTSSTLQPQQSYVDFPDDMRRSPHPAAESRHSLIDRAPMQQTDVIPHHGDMTQEYSHSSVEAKHAALITNGKSPVPSENTTDIVSPMTQLHLEGATTDATDTSTLQTPTKSIESWDGERKRPSPTQHTDKIPTQELSGSQELCPSQGLDPSREALETSGLAVADVHQDLSQHHSAPPVVGRMSEDASSLSMGSRVPTQMTEPIG